MRESLIAVRYANALYGIVKPQERAGVAAQLETLQQVLADSQIKQFLTHPKTPQEQKAKLFATMQLSSPLDSFVKLVLAKGREEYLPAIAHTFQQLVNKAANKSVATVRSALPLDEKLQTELTDKLAKLTGKDISLEIKVDKSLWGGIVIEVDGKIIDASLSTTFQRFQQKLQAYQ